MLIAGEGDAPMPDALRALIGARVTLDGNAERIGDLVVLHVDAKTVRPS